MFIKNVILKKTIFFFIFIICIGWSNDWADLVENGNLVKFYENVNMTLFSLLEENKRMFNDKDFELVSNVFISYFPENLFKQELIEYLKLSNENVFYNYFQNYFDQKDNVYMISLEKRQRNNAYLGQKKSVTAVRKGKGLETFLKNSGWIEIELEKVKALYGLYFELTDPFFAPNATLSPEQKLKKIDSHVLEKKSTIFDLTKGYYTEVFSIAKDSDIAAYGKMFERIEYDKYTNNILNAFVLGLKNGQEKSKNIIDQYLLVKKPKGVSYRDSIFVKEGFRLNQANVPGLNISFETKYLNNNNCLVEFIDYEKGIFGYMVKEDLNMKNEEYAMASMALIKGKYQKVNFSKYTKIIINGIDMLLIRIDSENNDGAYTFLNAYFVDKNNNYFISGYCETSKYKDNTSKLKGIISSVNKVESK